MRIFDNFVRIIYHLTNIKYIPLSVIGEWEIIKKINYLSIIHSNASWIFSFFKKTDTFNLNNTFLLLIGSVQYYRCEIEVQPETGTKKPLLKNSHRT